MNAPKYRQIEDYIRSEIDKGNLKTGDQIMTEEKLCEIFNYSRMTVNKALIHLSENGYIKRIPGKGSFVSAPHVTKEFGSSSSFTEDMKSIGLIAGAKLLQYEVIKASDNPKIKSLLNLSDTDFIHYFIRLRTGNETPVAIQYTYISAKVIPAIDVSCLNSSFYGYLDSIGIERQRARMELKAVLPNENEKNLLHVDNVALLQSTHVTYTQIGNNLEPFEYIQSKYNGDMYSYITGEGSFKKTNSN